MAKDAWTSPPDLEHLPMERRSFIPGCKYVFATRTQRADGNAKSFHIDRVRRFVFIRDVHGPGGVVKHVFRSPGAGWIETFTDAQCMDYEIEMVKR